MASDYEKHEVEVLPREGALLINDGYRARKSERTHNRESRPEAQSGR